MSLRAPVLRYISRRLSPRDVVRTGAGGLRARPMRVFLSALGIAAMIGVVGISTSSHAELQHTLDRLGTNLLTASPGQTFTGGEAKLPKTSVDAVKRIRPVQSATATGDTTAKVYRNDRVPEIETGSINVKAARLDLLDAVTGQPARGRWLNDATSAYPAVVLGSGAADRLGIGAITPDTKVYLGGHWFSVTGVLAPVPLAPELDSAALVGWDIAERLLGFDGHPTMIYTRTADSAVRDILAATASPEKPTEVKVTAPRRAPRGSVAPSAPRWSFLCVADQECDLHPVLDRQLGEQVACVRLDGRDADAQPLGDLRVAQSVRDGLSGFEFSSGQCGQLFPCGFAG